MPNAVKHEFGTIRAEDIQARRRQRERLALQAKRDAMQAAALVVRDCEAKPLHDLDRSEAEAEFLRRKASYEAALIK